MIKRIKELNIQTQKNDIFKFTIISDNINSFNSIEESKYVTVIYSIEGNPEYRISGIKYNCVPGDILTMSTDESFEIINKDRDNIRALALYIEREYLYAHNTYKTDLLSIFEGENSKNNHLLKLCKEKNSNIKTLLEQIIYVMGTVDFGCDILSSSLIMQLVVLLNRYNNERINKELRLMQDQVVQDMIVYIKNNINKDLSIDTLASKVFLSKYYLMRRFKSDQGQSIHSYIIKERLSYARELIKKGMLLNDVCLECGYHNYSSFVRAFKKNYGLSPKHYQPKAEEQCSSSMIN